MEFVITAHLGHLAAREVLPYLAGRTRLDLAPLCEG
jgi:hypothetical protein